MARSGGRSRRGIVWHRVLHDEQPGGRGRGALAQALTGPTEFCIAFASHWIALRWLRHWVKLDGHSGLVAYRQTDRQAFTHPLTNLERWGPTFNNINRPIHYHLHLLEDSLPGFLPDLLALLCFALVDQIRSDQIRSASSMLLLLKGRGVLHH